MPEIPQEILYKTFFGQAVPIGQHAGADGKPKETGAANPLPVQLSGSSLDLRGLAASKPAANTVAIGTTYWSVDTDPLALKAEVSDGTKWTVMG